MVRNHRGRGQVSIAYLALLAVAIVLVVVLAVRQVWRSGPQGWVAKEALKAGDVIDARNLVRASLSSDTAPNAVVSDPSILVGRKVQRSIEKGAPISVADVTPPPAYKYLSDAAPEGKVIMSVPSSAWAVPLAQLRYGDRLELLASSSREGVTRVVGHGMIFLGSLSHAGGSGNTSALREELQNAVKRKSPSPGVFYVVAVEPSDVARISQALVDRNLFSYVLHGRQEITSGRPVEIAAQESSGQVELIVGANRSIVK